MSSQLRRLGLSDTKFELKYHSPKCSGLRPFKDYSSGNLGKQSKLSQVHSEGSKEMNDTVLTLAIDLLNKRQKEPCGISQHDRNPTKYVCLEANCLHRTGCSYCFLESHKNHIKVETKSCLRDLQDLRTKVQTNRNLLSSQIIIRKTQLINSIDHEVASIREEFLTNLDSLHRKIRESIELRFSSSIESYSSSQTNISVKDTIIQESMNEIEFDDSNIITCFMLESKPQPRPKVKTQHKTTKKGGADLSREEQQRLLGKLAKLNITQVQEYLKHESAQIREFLNSCKMYEQFFLELSASLTQFLAAFRRAIPAARTFSVGLVQPQILHPFPIRKE